MPDDEAQKQLKVYLDYFGLDTGYMLNFCFNQKKETGVKRFNVGEKVVSGDGVRNGGYIGKT
ncbi:MAG: hypothetical protein IJ661_07420 [Lachnospiraceae bacterium]|nr:hypothetical protein [Lachnospiraceae bacterium]